jgi:hypothetical protein
LFIDIKISKEYKFISLLRSFPDSCDNLVVDIESNKTTLNLDDVFASLLSKETSWKTMDFQTNDALFVRLYLAKKNKNKSLVGRFKSQGTFISHRQYLRKY